MERAALSLVSEDSAANPCDSFNIFSSFWRFQPVEPELRVSLDRAVKNLEVFGMSLSPDSFNRKAVRIGDVVWPFVRIRAGHNQELNRLGAKVREPGVVV